MSYKQRIALYGLSVETERAIKKYDDYEIVGLLDGFKKSGHMFGKPIISMEKALEMGIQGICVVARPGSCKAIARRIKSVCIENNIALWDIRGKDLLNDSREVLNVQEIINTLNEAISKETVSSTDVKVSLFLERLRELNIKPEDKVIIEDAFDVGYLFCAPVITDFVIWFIEQINNLKATNVWFGARDGYLIQKLCEIAGHSIGKYFYTSRIAAIRANIENDNDFSYVESMIYSGSLKDNMAVRFGIDVGKKPLESEGVKDFSDIILERSRELKDNYLRYIESINVRSGDIVFFDFVAKGTTQYFIKRLVPDNRIKGLYFLQLEQEVMNKMNIDVSTFYSKEELNSSEIFDNYYILETILTAPEPSVVEFSKYGQPIFDKETRTETAIECSLRVQEGIIAYFKKYIHRSEKNEQIINKSIDELFLKLIHSVDFQNEDFLKLVIEDPFFNRMTNITDVL